MKKSELNSICEEIYSRQITDLKSKIKEIAFESRDGSSNFEDFFRYVYREYYSNSL